VPGIVTAVTEEVGMLRRGGGRFVVGLSEE
jgi:hypothetical protein